MTTRVGLAGGIDVLEREVLARFGMPHEAPPDPWSRLRDPQTRRRPATLRE